MAGTVLPDKVYFDALSIARAKRSGVANTLYRTLQTLLKSEHSFKIILVVPLWKRRHLPQDILESKYAEIKTIPLPAKVMELLLIMRLMPPLDWVLGKGVYVFPNFKNWPLWKSRSLTYIHDVGFIRFPEYVEEKNLWYLTKFVRRWVARTDAIITVSEHAKQEIHDLLHVPSSAINVVYNGVDTAVFKKEHSRKIAEVKTRYKLPENEYLLAVGNLEPRKNLVRLIAAYTKLSETLQEKYPLVLVGGDSWRDDEIKRAIEKVNRTKIRIYRNSSYVVDEDLPAIVSGARALVHPAIYEGFGIPPLEAMACGIPVASSNRSSLHEVTGSAALTFDPENIDEITKSLKKILTENELRKSLIKQGYERTPLFTWEQSAAKLIAVITSEQTRGLKTGMPGRSVRKIYEVLDHSLRYIFGERERMPYTFPVEIKSKRELQKKVYKDFLGEQPYAVQDLLLETYSMFRHFTGKVLRAIKSVIRKSLHG